MYIHVGDKPIFQMLKVEDTLKMLSSYFVKQRLEFGLYGLYPKYRLHIQPMSVYLSLLSHTYIVTTLHKRTDTPQEDGEKAEGRKHEGEEFCRCHFTFAFI